MKKKKSNDDQENMMNDIFVVHDGGIIYYGGSYIMCVCMHLWANECLLEWMMINRLSTTNRNGNNNK